MPKGKKRVDLSDRRDKKIWYQCTECKIWIKSKSWRNKDGVARHPYCGGKAHAEKMQRLFKKAGDMVFEQTGVRFNKCEESEGL